MLILSTADFFQNFEFLVKNDKVIKEIVGEGGVIFEKKSLKKWIFLQLTEL